MEGKETLNIKDLCQSMNVPVVAVIVLLTKLQNFYGCWSCRINGWDRTWSGMYIKRSIGNWNPQATAIADCSAARNDYFKESGRYIPIIGDGGIVTGGDICKCLACGADAVMIGSPIAKSSKLQVKDFTGVWLLQVQYCQGYKN